MKNLILFVMAFAVHCFTPKTTFASVINVPADQPTVQAAIDVATGTDTILIAPGLYNVQITLEAHDLTFASWYLTTGDTSYISQTILDGAATDFVLKIKNTTGEGTTFVGLTIQNGDDGILPRAKFNIFHCIVRECTDGIDYENGSGGICKHNIFEDNQDDGIDLDNDIQIVIDSNIIRNNKDDGIEIRLHGYSGPLLEYYIRYNQIYGNREDGIQLIDYPDTSDRVFYIERNIIYNSRDVGIGIMGDGISNEDYSGYPMPEKVFVTNNTFVNNRYGITGGANLVCANNIIIGCDSSALKNQVQNSIVSHTTLWDNMVDIENSIVDSATLVFSDPNLDSLFCLPENSTSIDSGTAWMEWIGDTVLNMMPTEYSGSAPDIGAKETIQTVFLIDVQKTDITCNGLEDGTATVLLTGGTGPFSYLWSDGQTDTTAIELAEGMYSVTVTDFNGNTVEISVEIEEPNGLSLDTDSEPTTCIGTDDGSAGALASGGTPGYLYIWSNGQTGSNIENLASGIYTVTVMDVNNCSTVEIVEVYEPDPIEVDFTLTHNDCHGTAGGQAVAAASGGNGPYFYMWSNGTMGTTIDNLEAGNYTVTIMDMDDCSINQMVEITQPPLIELEATTTGITCHNDMDGAAMVSGSGGVMPYEYNWNTGQTGDTLMNLDGGTYTVTMTDGNDCTQELDLQIFEPPVLNAIANGQGPLCNGGMNGFAIASGSGGTMPYTYSWSNGQVTDSIVNLGHGIYAVTVVDANGCTASSNDVIISEPPVLTLEGDIFDVGCHGDSTGVIDVTPSGGFPPYLVVWDTGLSLDELPTGTYTATITDFFGCESIETISIDEPTELGIQAIITNASTFGVDDGSVLAFGIGGAPPYTFEWNTGATTDLLSNVPAGVYTVTISDENHCETQLTVEVDQPTSVDDLNKDIQWSVFPNPNTGRFNVEWALDGEKEAIINIFDVLGRKVNFEQTLLQNGGKNSVQIDLGQATEGIYFVVLELGAKKVIEKLFLYEK